MGDDEIITAEGENAGAADAAPGPVAAAAPVYDDGPLREHFTTQIGELRGLIEQALRRQAAETAPAGPVLTPEQQEQNRQAAVALRAIIQGDPELKNLLALAKGAPQLVQGYQNVQTIQERVASVAVQNGQDLISQAARAANMAAEPADLERYERFVTGIIKTDPAMLTRWHAGDVRVVNEAFAMFKDALASSRREGAVALAETKDRVRRLPPAPRGGLPGAPAPVKLEEGKEREYERGLHTRAAARLAELLKG